MKQIKIKLITIGYLPFKINFGKICKWKSDIFRISFQKDRFRFQNKSDLNNWGYSDSIIEKELPTSFEEADILIGVTYVSIEDNYYSRCLKHNRIIFSFSQVAHILNMNNIELEKFLLLDIYYYSIFYLLNNNSIPSQSEENDFVHHDTRKCIGDMHGRIDDIVFSLDKPDICTECTNKLEEKKISNNIIELFRSELKRIKPNSYTKIASFVKKHPIIAIFLSFLFGLLISLLGNILFMWLTNYLCLI